MQHGAPFIVLSRPPNPKPTTVYYTHEITHIFDVLGTLSESSLRASKF